MGTSRRRTPPAPVSAGPPKGARAACCDSQKISKSGFGFKRVCIFLVNSGLRTTPGRQLPAAKKFFPGGLDVALGFSRSFSVPETKGAEEDDMTNPDRGFDENAYD